MENEADVVTIDPADFILNEQRSVQSRAMNSLDANPDDAARAAELSEATGAHPAVVYDNLEQFQTQHKASLTSQLLSSNKYLSEYINSHPLADKISNDDYGNLDEVSQSLTKLHSQESILGAAVRGFKEGFGDRPIGSFAADVAREYNTGLLSTAAWYAVSSPVELTLNTLSGLIRGATEAAGPAGEAAYKQFGGSESGAKSFGRAAQGMVEMLTQQPHVVPHIPITPEVVAKARETALAARPWIDAGVEPPLGVHPEIDRIKIEQSNLDLKNLDEAFKASQQALTRERNPDIFAGFLRQHGEAKIGLSGEAIAKLYGDKLPEVDDGKLGFVPDLADQLQRAAATGGDVEIPLADWLAKVEPEVAKELHDDIRVRPGGITKNEATVAKAMVEAYHGSPHEFDAFSMEKIGTGEGAQSYGHGLYFAENPKVAESYARPRIGRKATPEGTFEEQQANRYRVRIHADKEQFLDWDKPLSEQPKIVQDAVAKLVRENPEIAHRLKSVMEGGNITKGVEPNGMDLYSVVGRGITKGKIGKEADTAATQALREAGIPGIKYLDQGSRGKAEGTHNFVLFDASLAEITHRNDIPLEPKVAAVRAQAGLKPLWERKLSLQRAEDAPLHGEASEVMGAKGDTAQVFKIVDENGAEVGALHVAEEMGGKRLYIDDIEGINRDKAANTLGPSAIRSLLRQLKAEFPNAEELTGFRVSGARDKAGSWEEKGKVTIKLSDPIETWEVDKLTDEWAKMSREDIGGEVDLIYKPTEAYTKSEAHLTEQVQSILSRIAPDAETRVVQRVEMKGREVGGAYVGKPDVKPIIAVALNATDAGKTARHEAIHYLRDNGFFDEGEWKALSEAAQEGQWLGKYNIRERYKKYKLDEEGLLEEAIAEEFGKWGSETEPARKRYNSAVQKAFDKLAEFFKEVLEAIKSTFGHTPTVDELFEKIESGEVGRRESAGATEGGTKVGASEKEPELPGTRRMEDREPFTGRFPGWMTKRQREKYLQLIEKREQEDIARLEKKALEQIERERSHEWKENKKAVEAEVSEGIEGRPDIAADRLFGNGVLYGDKLETKPKLAKEFLTEEQIKALPPEYVSDRGIHPDDLAGLFGYQSGAELVDRLAALTSARRDAGMTPAAYSKRLVEIETQRVMNERYGENPAEALEEAKDYALSQTQEELLHEQTLQLATGAGLEFSITRDQLRAAVRENFGKTPIEAIDSNKFMNDAGRAGRAMEDAFLKGDVAEAFRQSQRQYLASMFAKEAVKLEKELAQFDKVTKRFRKREIAGIEPSAVLEVRDLLERAGLLSELDSFDIRNLRSSGEYGTLGDYVESKSADGWEPNVSGPLIDGRVSKFEQMPVDEFREFRDAIKSIEFIGRKEKKILVAGREEDFAEWKKGVLENIKELPFRAKEKQMKLLFRYDAMVTRMEEIVKDLDLRRELGPLFNVLIRPMIEAKHKEYLLQEELSKTFGEIKAGGKAWQKTLNDSIPNDFFLDPDTGAPFDLSRQHMINIMLNFGNKSNREKFTRGWGGKEGAKELEAKLTDLISRHATKEDWDFVQKVGDIFETWRKETDRLYTNLSGTAPRWIQIDPIQTPHGEYRGWYFPIIYDAYHSNIEVIKERHSKDPFERNYFKATTAAGHTKERTGFIAAVEFQNSIEQVAARMQQMMHDISYRAAVIEARKVIGDKQIRDAIRKHYGMEYEKQLDPWLKDIANHFNMNEQGVAEANNFLRKARFNLITNALGASLKLILSPDVGKLNPAAVARTWSDYSANEKLAMEKSKEIPHTFRNMDRDFNERLERAVIENKWEQFQTAAIKFAFTPVVGVSQRFRVITFVDEYKKALARGLEEQDAIAIADSAVRERHGATGVPDLPAIMRSSDAMKMATIFYGYFNTMGNWQRQIPGQLRRGEYSKALGTLYGAVFINAVFGAALFNKADKDETVFKTWAKALVYAPLSTIVFGRELASYMFEGYGARSPWASIVQAMGSSYSDIKRYVQGKKATKPVQHTLNTVGLTLGLPLGQAARTSQFLADVNQGKQRPKNILEWYRGVVFGEAKPK